MALIHFVSCTNSGNFPETNDMKLSSFKRKKRNCFTLFYRLSVEKETLFKTPISKIV